MKEIIINNIYITIIVSYIIGYSGIIDIFKRKLFRLFNGKKIAYNHFTFKPFDCELCMTFWLLIFYNIYKTNQIIFSLLLASIFSFIAPIIVLILNKLYQIINDKLC